MSKSTTGNEEILSLLNKSLIRVCGGGIVDRPNPTVGRSCFGNNEDAPPSPHCRNHHRHHDSTTKGISSSLSLWRENLESLALKSISFPNGDKSSSRKNKSIDGGNCDVNGSVTFKSDNTDNTDTIGKGHDVEIRIAQSLFNRYCNSSQSNEGRNRKKKKEKKKKKLTKKRRLHGEEEVLSKHTGHMHIGKEREKQKVKTVDDEKHDVTINGPEIGGGNEDESCNNKSIPSAPPQSANEDVDTLEIMSDLGLVRTIYSSNDLATVLVKDMEDQLWDQRTNDTNVDDVDAIANDDDIPLTSNNSVMMVQSNQSGIICIVTKKRFTYLTNLDRYPCSHCIKWCKGQKGLWWHEQIVHGLDHSSAAMVASSSSSSYNNQALVLYDEKNDISTIHKKEEILRNEVKLKEQEKKENDQDPYFKSIKNGNLNYYIQFLEKQEYQDQSKKYDAKSYLDKNGASALHWAAGCGHIEIVKYLIEQCQCPPDQIQKGKRSFHGRTPLHWSARNGHLDVVKYLIEQCNVDIDAGTIDGTTAFCWASWQGHFQIIEYLHIKGANIKSVNSFGCNAILWSAQSTQSGLKAIQFLEKIGCDSKKINSNGHGVLHKSAQRGKKDVCEWIFLEMERQAQMNSLVMIAPDAEYCCPSDLAGMEGHKELAKWLVDKEIELCIEALNLKNDCSIPSWLEEGLLNAKHLANRSGLHDLWEGGAAVKKIATFIEREGKEEK